MALWEVNTGGKRQLFKRKQKTSQLHASSLINRCCASDLIEFSEVAM